MYALILALGALPWTPERGHVSTAHATVTHRSTGMILMPNTKGCAITIYAYVQRETHHAQCSRRHHGCKLMKSACADHCDAEQTSNHRLDAYASDVVRYTTD